MLVLDSVIVDNMDSKRINVIKTKLSSFPVFWQTNYRQSTDVCWHWGDPPTLSTPLCITFKKM